MIVPIPVMYGDIGEAMFRYGEMKAKESNREWLKSLEKKFVKAFDKNDFNIMTFEPLTYGVKCFVTSRKYPNLYASIEITEDNITNDVVFRYYVNEKKWNDMHIDITKLMMMFGITNESEKPKRWNLFRKKKADAHTFTIDQFWETFDCMIRLCDTTPIPYKFKYESDNLILDIGKDDAENWFPNGNESVIYWADKDTIRHSEISLDNTQRTLLQMFKTDFAGNASNIKQ